MVARFVAPDDVKASMQTIGAIEATFSPLPTGFSSPCSWRSGDAFGCVYECWISRVFANGFGVSFGLVDGLKVCLVLCISSLQSSPNWACNAIMQFRGKTKKNLHLYVLLDSFDQ